jgi:hypothetical protein
MSATMSRKRARITESSASSPSFVPPPSMCFAPKRPRLPSAFHGEKKMGRDLFGASTQPKSRPARNLFGGIPSSSNSTSNRRFSLFSEGSKEEDSGTEDELFPQLEECQTQAEKKEFYLLWPKNTSTTDRELNCDLFLTPTVVLQAAHKTPKEVKGVDLFGVRKSLGVDLFGVRKQPLVAFQ